MPGVARQHLDDGDAGFLGRRVHPAGVGGQARSAVLEHGGSNRPDQAVERLRIASLGFGYKLVVLQQQVVTRTPNRSRDNVYRQERGLTTHFVRRGNQTRIWIILATI